MVSIFRRYQQTLMLVVTVLVIISFVWFYNVNKDPSAAGSDEVGSIYGRTVRIAEFGREVRKFEIARNLMLFELLQTLAGQARSMDEAKENFAWNSIVVRHEADALGVSATDDEVIAAIQKLPAFQTNGAYDSTKYNLFTERVLAPNGFTPDVLESLVRDDLRVQKLKALLGSTVAAAPSEIRAAFERRSRKSEVSVVRLKMEDVEKTVQVSDEDVKKTFEDRKETLRSDELRKVRFVAFTLPPTEKPLAGKERVAAMEKLADQASELSVAMTEKDAKLEAVAQKFNAEVKETAPFSVNEPPAELGKSDEVARVAFEKLTLDQPNSDVVMTENGYYVLQLAEVMPAKPLTFEEAQPKLAEQLKKERAQEALNLKAADVRAKIQAEKKLGKSISEAAAAAGVQVESIPAFSPMEPPKSELPDSRIIMGSSMDLAEGELSEPVPTPTGVLLVHIDKRLPVDEAKFEQEKAMIAENVVRAQRESLFELWLKTRRDVADIKTSQG